VLSERAGVGCADVLVKEGDMVPFGRHALKVLETPGHTSSCISFLTDDESMVFTGDALLVRGCGRTDFQEGDAHALYRSVHGKLFPLPAATTVFPAHDYKGQTATTIDEEKRLNPRLGGGRTEAEFVDIMKGLKLAYPKKIDVALPRNLRCGTAVQAADPQLQSGWYPIVGPSGVPEVTAGWIVEHRNEVRIIDVREPQEFTGELGHIDGAELVPLDQLSSATGYDDPRPTVAVCRSGGRSAKAVQLLHDRSFARVASLKGGMTAWNAAGLPVRR
jgi:rhodanese-related sulfurtransferase